MTNRKPSKCLKLQSAQLKIHFIITQWALKLTASPSQESAIAVLFHLHHVSHSAAYSPDLFCSNGEWKKLTFQDLLSLKEQKKKLMNNAYTNMFIF